MVDRCSRSTWRATRATRCRCSRVRRFCIHGSFRCTQCCPTCFQRLGQEFAFKNLLGKEYATSMSKATTKRDPRVDAYSAKAADIAKPILVHLREVVAEGCLEAVETVK